MEVKFPAPWHLTGKGYILLYHFNKSFVDNQGFIPSFLNGRFAGGLGSVMLVDYEKSDAGPYQELLFIPGKFKHHQSKLNTISKIYVSTMESVINGRNNWGIPKELASFSFEDIGEGQELIKITSDGSAIANFKIKTHKLSFPVNTRFLPFPLVQQYNDSYLYTTFSGKGTGHLAKLEEASLNQEYFPDISLFKPLIVIKVDPFQIIFPKPKVTSLHE